LSGGFTIIELLVVIGIIALLASLLFPVISNVRNTARETDTRNVLTIIDQACERYYTDFRAYPGPISDAAIANGGAAIVFATGVPAADWATGPINFGGAADRFTGAENLVLGLSGGLTVQSGSVVYDPRLIGQGPASLNALRGSKPTSYLQNNAQLSFSGTPRTGKFSDEAGAVAPSRDSIVPEFVDRFPGPMPILYIRARPGVSVTGTINAGINNIVTDGTGSGVAAYHLAQILPYTNSSIGNDRALSSSEYIGTTYNAAAVHGLRTVVNPVSTTLDRTAQFPFNNAYAYLVDRTTVSLATSGHRPRNKDRFILISAGRDRVYGTDDDITNFGKVGS